MGDDEFDGETLIGGDFAKYASPEHYQSIGKKVVAIDLEPYVDLPSGFSDYKAYIKHLERSNSLHESQSESYESEIARLKNKIREIDEDNDELGDYNIKYEEEIEDLKKQLKERD